MNRDSDLYDQIWLLYIAALLHPKDPDQAVLNTANRLLKRAKPGRRKMLKNIVKAPQPALAVELTWRLHHGELPDV